MSRFKLTIQLGNEAMQTPFDVAHALEALSVRISNTTRDYGNVFDDNGNNVGTWSIN
jgi:hypothetical protein